jgi:hypothetical protein
MRHWPAFYRRLEVTVAKDPFSVVDADLAQVRASVKADVARRLRQGAVIGSARDGDVMATVAAPGGGQVSRVVKRYKKATIALTQRTRQKAATPA